MSIPKMDKSGIRRILITAVVIICASFIGIYGYSHGKEVREAIVAPESPSEETLIEEVVAPTFEQEVLEEGLEAAIEAVNNDAEVIEEVEAKKPGFLKRFFSKEAEEEEGVITPAVVLTVHPDTFVSAKALDALMTDEQVSLCSERKDKSLAITLCSEVSADVVGEK